ncbi:MAG TPA: hypothetical protein VGM03_05480 [Phycisphaerae bacterium]|jgi:hypothetical protein
MEDPNSERQAQEGTIGSQVQALRDPEDRRKLLAILAAERFRSALAQSDRQRAGLPDLTDEEIQAEIDAVRALEGHGCR